MQTHAPHIELQDCTVQTAIQRIADGYQVDFVTFHLFRSGEDAQNKPYVRTNYPHAWVSHYLLNDYVRIDPVLQMAERVAGPFCWSEIAATDQQLDMLAQAISHGVGATGFSVRHVDAVGRRSVLSFNAQTAHGGESWAPYLDEMRDGLIRLAYDVHHMALTEVYRDGPLPPQLSPREIECLKWTAAGKAHTDIAVILDLSEHTVRGYLKDARQKLDAVSLAQAVSKATALGLI